MRTRREWDAYVSEELRGAQPLLAEFGFVLDKEQPHLGGERFLMQADTAVTGPKLILLGVRTDDEKRVVIKVTSNAAGKNEINAERRARAALASLNFSYRPFFAPEELLYAEKNGMTIAVQEFVEQERTFLARTIEEQFAFALEGFKIQEGAHATTYSHLRRIARVFPLWDSAEYLRVARLLANEAGDVDEALHFLESDTRTIEQYTGFLTHSDFMPHNIRIRDGKLYLLDHASIRFGNKYEGWARFIHFMMLYNPPLADALIQYVRDNRTPEESVALKLMRVYRLIEIVTHYTRIVPHSEGNLKELNEVRVGFWREVLRGVLHDRPLDEGVRTAYIAKRDALRSEDEKKRQVGLH